MASAASITGVFTILDRATGPMRKMEAQAMKTMAAIEGVGGALDQQKNSGYAQETEKLTRGFRNVERSGNLASRAMGLFGRETGKTNKEANAFVSAMQNIRDVAGGVAGILGGLKFGVLAAGIGVAVQAVGALAGGVVALIPKLADLAGVLAAGPAAAGAFAQGIVTLMVAIKPAMTAIGAGFKEAQKGMDPFAAAMAKLSPQGQSFVKQVIAMRPALNKLSNAAGIKLFPQLSMSLKDLSKTFPILQRNMTATGAVFGKAISGLTGDLTTKSRLADINTIMQSNTKVFGIFGQGLRSMVNGLMDLMIAAAPFSEWLIGGIGNWLKFGAASAKAGRETGSIARYLDGTKESLQLFGSILKNVWQLMTALGKAARPLGDRLWGGADRATRGWADFMKTAEGANKARKWFDSLYEPLHAMGQLAKTASVALFGMTENTSALTETTNALQGTIPALAELFTGASEAFGPSVARSLTAISELLAALPWSPLKIVLDAFTQMLVVVTALVKEVPGLGMVISVLLTVSLGRTLVGALGRMKLFAGAWALVSANIRKAAVSQALFDAASMGGGGGFRATTGPMAGMTGANAPVGGLRGLAGKASGIGGLSRGGAGLGIGLIGAAASMGLGAAIGGDAGSKVSGIGSMASAGAGVGMIAGPWGALVGGLAGGVAGAISSGLFKGADKAKEAGKAAGKDFVAGLGLAGATNPAAYESLEKRVNDRTAAIAKARAALTGQGVALGTPGARGAAGQTGVRPLVGALDRAEANSVGAFTASITEPRSDMTLTKTKYVLEDTQKMFGQFGVKQKQAGAAAIMQWAKGMESKGQAVNGFTQRLFNGLVNKGLIDADRFGGVGKRAMAAFNAELKADKSKGRLRGLMGEVGRSWDQLNQELPKKITDANYPQVLDKEISFLKNKVKNSTGSIREKAKADLAEIRRLARVTARDVNKTFPAGGPQDYKPFDGKTGGPLAPKAPQGKPGGIFTNPFASATPGGPSLMKRVTVPAPSTSAATTALKGVQTESRKTGQGITNIADRTKIARDRIGTHVKGISGIFGTESIKILDSANAIIGATGADPLTVRGPGASTGNRFASGGRIPGAAKGDHIPLYGSGGLLGIADGGELVVNRHTEKRVNGMLAGHGTSLGKEVAGETRPHFAEGGRIPGRQISGGGREKVTQMHRADANMMLSKEVGVLNKYISMLQPMKGLGEFQGKQVSNWIISVLKYAQGQGWGGSVTSGYRSNAKQAAIKAGDSRAAAPGSSNHNSIDYPGGAVDVGGFGAKAEGSALNSKIGGFKGKNLVWGDGIKDYGHFSANGRAYGGRLNFAGWHGKGMNGIVSGPTLIGAGEKGRERVTVTPIQQRAGGKGGGKGNIEVHIGNIHYSAKGDVAKAIREEMELLSDELAMGGSDD
jgi:hypothetical protein